MEASCIYSPAPILPPTYNPTLPTMAPTVSFETISDITVQIVINDEDVTENEVLDVIEETTEDYLNTLFVEEDEYELTVTVISRDGDVLVVNIVIAVPVGDIIELNEREVVEENENEINEKFGSKVIVSNPYSVDENILFVEEWYFYVIILLLLMIVIGLILYLLKKKRSDTSDDLNRSEMITPSDDKLKKVISYSTANGDDEDEDIKVTDGDPNVDELYSVDDEKESEHVTQGLMDENDVISQEEDDEVLYDKGNENEETQRMTVGTNDGHEK